MRSVRLIRNSLPHRQSTGIAGFLLPDAEPGGHRARATGLSRSHDCQLRRTKSGKPHLAARKRLVEIIEALDAKGADLNAKDIQGKTPLRRPCSSKKSFAADSHGLTDHPIRANSRKSMAQYFVAGVRPRERQSFFY